MDRKSPAGLNDTVIELQRLLHAVNRKLLKGKEEVRAQGHSRLLTLPPEHKFKMDLTSSNMVSVSQCLKD